MSISRRQRRDGGTRTPAYLKINPAGHIPAIDDDGFALSESMAINLYLAKKAGKLYPGDRMARPRLGNGAFG